MRNLYRRLAVLTALSLLGLVGVGAASGPVGAAAPTVGVVIDSEAGELVGGGAHEAFAPPTSFVGVTNGDADSVTFSVGATPCTGAMCEYVITLATPTGGAWAVGAYEGAQKAADADSPGIDVRSTGTDCTTTAGRFIVDAVTVEENTNLLTKFVGRFEQHCNGEEEALFGAVSFNGAGSDPWFNRTITADPTDFGKVVTGATSTKTVKLAKSAGDDLTPSGFSITGANAAAFAITRNTCTAAPVSVDCEVDVKFSPTTVGGAVAKLTWADQAAPLGPSGGAATTGTGRDVLLTGSGVLSQLTLTGDNGVFPETRVGTFSEERVVRVTNSGTEPVEIGPVTITGADAKAFASDGGCDDVTLLSGTSCEIAMVAYPMRHTEGTGASHAATLNLNDDAGNGPHTVELRVHGTSGYWIGLIEGTVVEMGDAEHFGDMNDFDTELNAPMLGITGTSTGQGYWLFGSDGGIFSFGDAAFHGSTGSIPLNQPVLDMDATVDDSGYWLAALDGGVFAFDAPFHGSMGGKPLNKPVVGIAATPSGGGYWMVATDGGIFSFGDAAFKGSLGSTPLNQPIIGMAATSDGGGYWLVAADGGVFAFGNAGFFGSAAGDADSAVVGIEPTPTGKGYWIVEEDGTVHNKGDAVLHGQLLSGDLPAPAVGMAGSAPIVDPAGAAGYFE